MRRRHRCPGARPARLPSRETLPGQSQPGPPLHPPNRSGRSLAGLSASQSLQGSEGIPPSPHRASQGLQGGAEGRGGHTLTSRAELFRELEGTGRARRTRGRRRGALRAATAGERRRRERGPRAPRSLSLRGHQNHLLKLPGRAWPEPPRRKQPFSFPFPASLLAGSGPFLPASHQKRAPTPQAFRLRELSWGRRR